MRIEIGKATLYLGDCRDILPTLPKVDAVITDPPYGIGMDGGKIGKAEYEKLSDWDSKPADVSFILDMNVPCVIFGGNYFHLPPTKCWLVWDKETAGVTTFADAELAWTNLDKAVRLLRHLWSGPYMKIKETRYHPTQKPLRVMTWAIEQAGSHEVIFDPFMGSGTTGVAAVQMGRSFIGIEREPKYFDIACKRIEDAQRMGDMFGHDPQAKPKQESLL